MRVKSHNLCWKFGRCLSEVLLDRSLRAVKYPSEHATEQDYATGNATSQRVQREEKECTPPPQMCTVALLHFVGVPLDCLIHLHTRALARVEAMLHFQRVQSHAWRVRRSKGQKNNFDTHRVSNPHPPQRHPVLTNELRGLVVELTRISDYINLNMSIPK